MSDKPARPKGTLTTKKVAAPAAPPHAPIRVAMVGATGAVGRTLLDILEQRDFPISNMHLLASERSAGERIPFKGKNLLVTRLDEFDFSQVDIAFFSAGGSVSKEFAPKAAAAGAIVIDNTSHFRYMDDIPLIVAEVNGDVLDGVEKLGIIANPNCSTMQMLVALAPIHAEVGITRINVATYQSVSGAGATGIKELGKQTAAILNFQPVECEKFPVQIAFNLIPHIDEFQDNGYTKEELKMVWETHKILRDPTIGVNPTCVRVPVFYGHSEAVHLETKTPISVAKVRSLLRKAPGVKLVDEAKAKGYPTPVTHAAGKDPVYVGRIRQDLSHPNGIAMWIVSDNIRKGAALNAVQIAELLLAKGRVAVRN
jgi:aspartate-semialdehyde dehydrogenase